MYTHIACPHYVGDGDIISQIDLGGFLASQVRDLIEGLVAVKSTDFDELRDHSRSRLFKFRSYIFGKVDMNDAIQFEIDPYMLTFQHGMSGGHPIFMKRLCLFIGSFVRMGIRCSDGVDEVDWPLKAKKKFRAIISYYLAKNIRLLIREFFIENVDICTDLFSSLMVCAKRYRYEEEETYCYRNFPLNDGIYPFKPNVGKTFPLLPFLSFRYIENVPDYYGNGYDAKKHGRGYFDASEEYSSDASKRKVERLEREFFLQRYNDKEYSSMRSITYLPLSEMTVQTLERSLSGEFGTVEELDVYCGPDCYNMTDSGIHVSSRYLPYECPAMLFFSEESKGRFDPKLVRNVCIYTDDIKLRLHITEDGDDIESSEERTVIFLDDDFNLLAYVSDDCYDAKDEPIVEEISVYGIVETETESDIRIIDDSELDSVSDGTGVVMLDVLSFIQDHIDNGSLGYGDTLIHVLSSLGAEVPKVHNYCTSVESIHSYFMAHDVPHLLENGHIYNEDGSRFRFKHMWMEGYVLKSTIELDIPEIDPWYIPEGTNVYSEDTVEDTMFEIDLDDSLEEKDISDIFEVLEDVEKSDKPQKLESYVESFSVDTNWAELRDDHPLQMKNERDQYEMDDRNLDMKDDLSSDNEYDDVVQFKVDARGEQVFNSKGNPVFSIRLDMKNIFSKPDEVQEVIKSYCRSFSSRTVQKNIKTMTGKVFSHYKDLITNRCYNDGFCRLDFDTVSESELDSFSKYLETDPIQEWVKDLSLKKCYTGLVHDRFGGAYTEFQRAILDLNLDDVRSWTSLKAKVDKHYGIENMGRVNAYTARGRIVNARDVDEGTLLYKLSDFIDDKHPPQLKRSAKGVPKHIYLERKASSNSSEYNRSYVSNSSENRDVSQHRSDKPPYSREDRGRKDYRARTARSDRNRTRRERY
jgi:hypothetical protein